jgi:hypothetical protein
VTERVKKLGILRRTNKTLGYPHRILEKHPVKPIADEIPG